MKKTLIALALSLGLVASVSAVDITSSNPPYVSKFGSKMKTGSFVAKGSPKAPSCEGYIATAAVDITAGQVLVLAGTTYPLSVSGTTTAADPAAFGIALADASFGGEVQVCSTGKWRAETTALAITYGDLLVTSGTAGDLTGTAVAAEDTYTGLSKTAIIGRALETKTTTASDSKILIQILGY